MTKVCNKCGIEKELSEFRYREDTHKYRNTCKKCTSDKAKATYLINKDQKKETVRAYYNDNKESVLKYKKEYYGKNKHELYQKHREYVIKNRQSINKYLKDYRTANKERCRELRKANIRKNREKYKEYHRHYYKNRSRIDMSFKLTGVLRTRVRNALKNNCKIKSAKTMELIGCSVDFLRNHLQRQFAQGMTWDNYGKWQIDHIIPCSSFDLTDPEQQHKCFNWKNMQPLWAEDNRKKYNKIPA